MVVDLGRSRSVSPQVYQDFVNCRLPHELASSLNTLPVPISRKDCPFKTRFVFAYGVDNSDRPSYLLWPIRGGNGQFLLVDPWSGNYFDLEAAKFMEPIGIEHFFDAFSLDKKRPLKVDAASALRIRLNEVSDLLVVNQDRANRFELTPVWAPVEPPTKRAKTAEVRLSSASDVPMPPKKDDNEKGSSDEEASDSSGSNSDVSSQDDSSDVSDLEKFDEAYTDFSALTDGVDPQTLERDGSGHPNDEVPGIDLPGGMKALYSLANVPKSWPLARLTIPLSAASKHLERLLEGCCMEIFVRNTNPDLQLHFVRKFAKDLVVVFAFHLAETISALFRHVLDHPSKVLYDPETEPLFLPIFWFYPIYREMLNSASRHRPSKSMELRRAASGLVKVICRTEESRPGGRGRKPGKPKKKGLLASFEEWFGSINMMNILYVWFPASWGPSVVEAIQTRNVTCLAKKPIVRDPHIFDRKEAARGSRAREVTCWIQKWNIKAEGFHPILVANARVDWLAMDDDDIKTKGIFCVARCPTTKTYGVNAPSRDQFCVRMARLITIQLPPLDSPEIISGGIFSLRSSVRTPMKRDASLEKIWRMLNGNGKPRKSTFCSTKRMAATLLALTWPWHFKALTLKTLQRIMQLKTRKHYMHVDGRQKKVFTVSRGRLCLMYVMHLSTMTMLLPLAQMSNRDGGTGMKTMLRDINVIPDGTGQGIPYASLWSSTYESFGPLRTFHSFFTTCLTIQ